MRRLSAIAILPTLLLLASTASAQATSQPGTEPKPGAGSGSGTGASGGASVGGSINPTGADVKGDGNGDVRPGPPGDAKPDADPNAGPQPTAAIDQGSAGARTAGMLPSDVNYGNFMDTRLTWSFGDDDFLHKTASSSRSPPRSASVTGRSTACSSTT